MRVQFVQKGRDRDETRNESPASGGQVVAGLVAPFVEDLAARFVELLEGVYMVGRLRLAGEHTSHSLLRAADQPLRFPVDEQLLKAVARLTVACQSSGEKERLKPSAEKTLR